MNALESQPEDAHEPAPEQHSEDIAYGEFGHEIYVHPLHTEHALNLPFWRDNNRLWALDVPSEEIPMEALSWMIEIPFWEDAHGNIVIAPREVLERPADFPGHYARIVGADTSYPIDITHGKGRWIILDGIHRLAKLYMQGESTLQVRKIPEKMIWETRRG